MSCYEKGTPAKIDPEPDSSVFDPISAHVRVPHIGQRAGSSWRTA